MDMLPLAALVLAILGPMAAITIGFAMLLSNQIKASEQRINDQIKMTEMRLTEQIKMTEMRLTEQYRETNRDTKTLIRDVAFLQGSLGIAPRRQESDTDGAAEAAD